MCKFVAAVIALIVLVPLSARPAAAATSKVTFVIPQTIDPPPVTFGNAGTGLFANSGDLAGVGMQLHGRVAGSHAGMVADILRVQMHFTFSGNVVVNSASSFNGVAPWIVTTSHSGSDWVLTFTATPESAPLNDAFSKFSNALVNVSNPDDPTNINVSNITFTATATGLERDAKFPVVAIGATVTNIWSPNHTFVQVDVSGVATDAHANVNPNSGSFSVADEYGLVQPSGPVTLTLQPDGSYRYSFSVFLDSSRLGGDADGRSYSITVHATDSKLNDTSVSTGVLVVHDQSG